ncbi:MAG: DNA-binding protein [Bdellovibrionaceae bacterium]|nr:DNA-binding protein [Pseudobdellovibrionaceae bacterium]
MEEELYSAKVQVERKLFFFDMRRNQRGTFLKITEDVNGRRDSIIIPATGLHDVRTVIDQIIDSCQIPDVRD